MPQQPEVETGEVRCGPCRADPPSRFDAACHGCARGSQQKHRHAELFCRELQPSCRGEIDLGSAVHGLEDHRGDGLAPGRLQARAQHVDGRAQMRQQQPRRIEPEGGKAWSIEVTRLDHGRLLPDPDHVSVAVIGTWLQPGRARVFPSRSHRGSADPQRQG